MGGMMRCRYEYLKIPRKDPIPRTAYAALESGEYLAPKGLRWWASRADLKSLRHQACGLRKGWAYLPVRGRAYARGIVVLAWVRTQKKRK